MRQLPQFVRARNAPVILVMVSLALVPVIGLAAPRPAESRVNIAGTVQGLTTPVIEDNGRVGLDVVSMVTTGSRAAKMTAEGVVEKLTPGGAIYFGGAHFFTVTRSGDLQTEDSDI